MRENDCIVNIVITCEKALMLTHRQLPSRSIGAVGDILVLLDARRRCHFLVSCVLLTLHLLLLAVARHRSKLAFDLLSTAMRRWREGGERERKID